ncbi:MAG TPA: nuclease [Gammaproteobacteria bacterium]|nr:nuclease [Gammaproteobacteria bacterium]
MDEHLYYYRALVQSVYDGDTCTLNIDLGLGTWLHGEHVRLARINCPELRGDERPAGLRARDFVRNVLMPEGQAGTEIWIKTLKDKKGKFGRYIADIWVKDANGQPYNLNDTLVAEGHAQYVDY